MDQILPLQLPGTPQCDVCKSPKTTLDRITIAAGLGCSCCQVLRAGVQAFVPATVPEKDIIIRPGCYKSYTSVILPRQIVKEDLSQGSGKGQSFPEFYYLELYTRLHKPTVPWSLVASRRSIEQPRELTYQGVALQWARNCQANHNCTKSLAEPSVLPSRVLDVGCSAPKESDPVRLHVSTNQRATYTALSYCWGQSLPLITTRATFGERQSCISFQSLPKAFQNAVCVTRALGIQYLWVDALCIIQDDAEDWEVQSGNMARIYECAHLVISADVSDGCDRGFLSRNSEPRREVKIAEVATAEGPLAVIYAREGEIPNCEHPDLRVYSRKDPNKIIRPVGKRAWTLQEELLATRIIHFAHRELFWVCREASWCECTELDDLPEITTQIVGIDKLKQNLQSCGVPGILSLKGWGAILDNFVSRAITVSTDRLPAISGIAHHLNIKSEKKLGQYLAGLWSGHLPHALLWHGFGNQGRRATPYRAPTWSWASVDRIQDSVTAQPFYQDIMFDDNSTPLGHVWVEVRKAWCKPSGRDPFGAVSDGRLRITGPLLEVECMSASLPDEGTAWFPKDHVHLRKVFGSDVTFDFDLQPSIDRLYWLFIATYLNIHVDTRAFPSELEPLKGPVLGLVLREAPKTGTVQVSRPHHSCVFERVGIFNVFLRNPGVIEDYRLSLQMVAILKGSENKTISII